MNNFWEQNFSHATGRTARERGERYRTRSFTLGREQAERDPRHAEAIPATTAASWLLIDCHRFLAAHQLSSLPGCSSTVIAPAVLNFSPDIMTKKEEAKIRADQEQKTKHKAKDKKKKSKKDAKKKSKKSADNVKKNSAKPTPQTPAVPAPQMQPAATRAQRVNPEEACNEKYVMN
uniref:Uncharacterized protein n=1 Tax=Globodera rostochiensis TaxID=31243 RepID=A0A914ICH0_GLORO